MVDGCSSTSKWKSRALSFLSSSSGLDNLFEVTICVHEGSFDLSRVFHLFGQPTSKLLLHDIKHRLVREKVCYNNEQCRLAHLFNPIDYALTLLTLLF